LGRVTTLLGMYYWIWQIVIPVGLLIFALEAVFEVVMLVKKGTGSSMALQENIGAQSEIS